MHPADGPDLSRRYLELLDWSELRAELASRAGSSRGVSACHGLPLCDTPTQARERMAEVSEALAVLRAGESLPLLDFPEIEAHLCSVMQGIPLGPGELSLVAALCDKVAEARRFFGRIPSQAAPTPRLSGLAAQLGYHDELVRMARDTFAANGELRDDASPELGRLRHQRDQITARAREQAERLMLSEEYAPYLMDQFVTLREDRFVLPLRASFKSMGLGIVHDTSRTGETVFVEPTALVDLNNRLKVAEIEIRRESRRILDGLAAAIAAAAPRLREDRELLTRLDVICAAARLSQAYGGSPVEIVAEPIVDLLALRHPLLALRAGKEGGREVTANDFVLGDVAASSQAKVLVVSGPNAGGKTVLLKSIGLAALLARAGLHVPVAAGSRVGFFAQVLADIGDQQSVLGDLSTFSAHLANLAGILAIARGAPGQNLLILCDELMVGTHPEQGAALARAMLEAMAEGPGLVVVTTHFDSLKALAEDDSRFRNAGMAYDPVELRPTFRLEDGTPGRSYALDIAARIGLPEQLILRAQSLMSEGSLALEETVRNLQERERALARARQELDDSRHELERARRELEERAGAERAAADALLRREHEVAVRSRAAIDAAVREARAALSEILRDARREKSPQAVQAARLALDHKVKEMTAELPEAPPLNVSKLRDALAQRGFGSPPSPSKPAPPAPVTVPVDPPLVARPGVQALDLRGYRAEEALVELEAFLDRAALAAATTVIVIHGYGSGVLRRAVREYLATSTYVMHYRQGVAGEGGDGVSVVSLKG